MKNTLLLLLTLSSLFTNAQEIVKQYYPSGAISQEGLLKMYNKPVGKWIEYYENGTVSRISNYDDDSKKTGTWKSFFKNGKIRAIKNYRNNQLDGVSIQYHKHTGLKEWENTYKHGLLIETKDYYENGNLHLFRRYDSYGETGEWQACEKNGKLFVLEHWDKGERNGLTKVYYSNFKTDMLLGSFGGNSRIKDSLQTRCKCLENKHLKSVGNYMNSYANGIWTTYFENGKIETKGAYQYVKKDTLEKSYETGLWTTYYKDGTVDKIGKYKKGKKTGKWKSYLNGKLYSVGKYKKGLAKGKWKIYYSSDVGGGTGFETHQKGKKNGRTKQYYANKKLLLKGQYKNDKKNGNWKWYNEKGKLTEEKQYDDGYVVVETYINNDGSKIIQYYSKKILLLRIGERKALEKWVKYDAKGKLIETSFFKDGKVVKTSKK